MNIKELKEYIEFMNTNDLCEIEVENDGKKVRLKKNSSNPVMSMPQHHPVIHHMPQIGSTEAKGSTLAPGSIEIKSPMVGTFYRSPSPGAKPYVEIGDMIKPGDVLCIVEAMKLMNEIKSEVAGKITQSPAENGGPVEFGQSLFIVEPA
jgi:acetyl-CoA carboxylase biotin carboxyl carrier protein